MAKKTIINLEATKEGTELKLKITLDKKLEDFFSSLSNGATEK